MGDVPGGRSPPPPTTRDLGILLRAFHWIGGQQVVQAHRLDPQLHAARLGHIWTLISHPSLPLCGSQVFTVCLKCFLFPQLAFLWSICAGHSLYDHQREPGWRGDIVPGRWTDNRQNIHTDRQQTQGQEVTSTDKQISTATDDKQTQRDIKSCGQNIVMDTN